MYWTIAIVVGAITLGALVFFAARYRGKTRSTAASAADSKTPRTVVIAVIIVMAVILTSAGIESFMAIALYEHPPSGPSVHVNVFAQRFAWSFNCTAGCDAHTPGVLTVPANTTIILNITSIDVFHSFGIPALRVKADAIPGRYNTLWFSAPVGVYRIQCYELCGNGHAFMIAKLNVVASLGS